MVDQRGHAVRITPPVTMKAPPSNTPRVPAGQKSAKK
jgi:hypothetical protein